MTRPFAPRSGRPAARVAGSLLAVSALLALTACAGSAVAETTPPSPDPASAIVSIPMPDLAPLPEPNPPLTEVESEAARIEQADREWAALTTQYPQAVRPDVAFEGYVTDDTRVDVMRGCYEAAGLPIDEGRVAGNTDGPPDSIGTSTSTEAEAVAAYACRVAHPTKITAGAPTDETLGWIYDYLVAFYAPCLEANGIEVEEPPGRDVWVETWPGYVWFPSYGDDPRALGPELGPALHEACPDPDTYLIEHRAG